jgi:hypothetical protein
VANQSAVIVPFASVALNSMISMMASKSDPPHELQALMLQVSSVGLIGDVAQ